MAIFIRALVLFNCYSVSHRLFLDMKAARDIVKFLMVAIMCLLLPVESAASSKDDMMRSFTEKCSKGFSFTCMKADFVKFLDTLEDQKDIELFAGLSLGKDEGVTEMTNSEIISGELFIVI